MGGGGKTGLSWNRCFLCSSPVAEVEEGVGEYNGGGRSKKWKLDDSVKLLMKYLLHDFKLEGPLGADVIAQWGEDDDDDGNHATTATRGQLGGGAGEFTAKLCAYCRELASSLTRLQLELEVIQMRIVRVVEMVRTAVVSNSRLYGGNDRVKQDFEELEERLARWEVDGNGEDCRSSGRSFLDVIHHFQTFVFENESKDLNIPLVYLERLTGGKKMNLALMSHVLHLGSHESRLNRNNHITRIIKEEPQDYFEPTSTMMMEETETDFELAAVAVVPPTEVKVEDESPPTTTRRPGGRKSAQLASARLNKQSLLMRRNRKKADDDDDSRARRLKRRQPVSQAELLYRQLMKDNNKGKGHQRKPKRTRSGRPFGLKCDECGYQVKTLNIYRQEQHLREHENETLSSQEERNLYECPDCKMGFKQKQYLEFHLPHHWRTRQCELCPERVTCLQMQSHLRTHHQVEKIFACQFCTTWTASFEALAAHLSNHTKVSVKCELCSGEDPTKYNVSAELRRHMSEAHGKRQLELQCGFEGCSEVFYNASSLSFHRTVQHKRGFSCSVCSKSFSTANNLDTHTRALHPAQVKDWYLCDAGAGPSSSSCQEKFLTESALLRHQMLEHNKPKYKCDKCPKEFLVKGSLHSHLRFQHGVGKEPQNFICSHCGKEARSKSRWLTHEASHTREMNFTCEICGFATHTEEWLRKHKKKHDESRERKFPCPHCQDSFFDSYSLKLHIRRHTGDRPYQCDECGSTFNQRSALNVHRKKHVEGGGGKVFVPRGPRSSSSRRKVLPSEDSPLPENSSGMGKDVIMRPPPPPPDGFEVSTDLPPPLDLDPCSSSSSSTFQSM